ncbi:MAG: TetR/AcrR family transcriptional regulator [Solirubrobacterales bacterium]|nr:TetR/AcrR family transcriptional regulator [Solirubrobacterales bacterium]
MARRGLDPARVVEAAARLADADGLPAVTLARVAAALDVRTPSLYNHVDGLDALRRGIALLGIAELIAALRDASVGRSGADALRAIARAQRAYALAHPGRYAAAAVSPPPDDAPWQAAGAEAVAVVGAALRGLDLGEEEQIHAIRGVRAAVHGFAALELAGGFGMAVDVDASFERLVDTLAAGLARR